MGGSRWTVRSAIMLGMLLWSGSAAAQQSERAERSDVRSTATLVAVTSLDAPAGTRLSADAERSLWLVSGGSSPANAGISTGAVPPDGIAGHLALPASAGRLLAAGRAETVDLRGETAVLMQRNRGPGYALAIAGGALFIAGLLAGDDAGAVLMLTGAGVGAYGLYLMLR